MKIESQVCSLEQAKKLKELGIVQSSIFIHLVDNDIREHIGLAWYYDDDKREKYAAYTVAELGEMLPTGYDTMKLTNWKNGFVWRGYDDSDSPCPSEKTYLTEAEARATMLIHIIESKLITVEEINNRLTCAPKK